MNFYYRYFKQYLFQQDKVVEFVPRNKYIILWGQCYFTATQVKIRFPGWPWGRKPRSGGQQHDLQFEQWSSVLLVSKLQV